MKRLYSVKFNNKSQSLLGSTLSGVVWEGEKDDEMAEGADVIKGWLDEPAKSWSEN